jgi:putative sporulation protein YyaC
MQDLPVVLCIGSIKVVGDSLGPRVGDILREKYNAPAFVYGGWKYPVNGINYFEYYRFLREKHPKSLIIAVDACVGNKQEVGKIKYCTEGLKAGEALNKSLPRIGDVGVLGVVCERSSDNLRGLSACSPTFIANMSEKIAYNIAKFISPIQKRNKSLIAL